MTRNRKAETTAVLDTQDPAQHAANTPDAPETSEAEQPQHDVPAIRWIDVAAIALDVPNHRHQSRHDAAALDKLAQSMREHGLRQPILVCERPAAAGNASVPYQLVYGHRRLAAAITLGWTQIKAEVREPLTREQLLVLRAVENLHREDLNVMEQVIAVEQVVEANGGDVARAAGELGQTTAWVQDRLYLGRCGEHVRELALADLLLAGHLRELAKIGDEEDQLKVALWACGGGTWWQCSYRTMKELIKDVKEKIEGAGQGEVRRQAVDAVRQQVAQVQRSLRGVPWVLGVPFEQQGLPACTGCAHNTATDATLFGDQEDGPSHCMRRGCFEAKAKATEKAQRKLVQVLVKKKAADLQTVREAVPAILRPEPVQRQVKKELNPTSPGASSKSKSADKPKEDSPAVKMGEAINKWGDDVRKWHHALGKKVEKAALLHTETWIGVVMCAEVKQIGSSSWRPERYYGFYESKPKMPRAPKQPTQPTPDQLVLVDELLSGDLQRLANALVGQQPSNRASLHEVLPGLLVRMAERLKVDAPPFPKWDDYIPAELLPGGKQASTTAKPKKKNKAKSAAQPPAAAPATPTLKKPKRAANAKAPAPPQEEPAAPAAPVEDQKSADDDGGGEERTCRKCGCTEANCQQCVEKTGQPCHWVDRDLCSACVDGEELIELPKDRLQQVYENMDLLALDDDLLPWALLWNGRFYAAGGALLQGDKILHIDAYRLVRPEYFEGQTWSRDKRFDQIRRLTDAKRHDEADALRGYHGSLVTFKGQPRVLCGNYRFVPAGSVKAAKAAKSKKGAAVAS